MGTCFIHFRKRYFVIISQKYLFYQVWAAPSGGLEGWLVIASGYTCTASYQPPLPCLKFQFSKITMMRNQIDEEKIDWLKWNQSKDCKLCFGCIGLVDAHIKICTIWLIKIYSFSFGELAGGAENSPLVLVDAWPLQFVCPCRWPRLGNWWAREAQLTELSHISRWGKVDTF